MFFDQVPERLVVPFAAIKGFLDLAVQFGLQFEVVPVEEQTASKTGEVVAIGGTPKAEQADTAESDNEAPDDSSEKKVVSLDAFRKK